MYLDLVLLPVFVRTENELVEVMEARASASPPDTFITHFDIDI
jgi:hypothetical protein